MNKTIRMNKPIRIWIKSKQFVGNEKINLHTSNCQLANVYIFYFYFYLLLLN